MNSVASRYDKWTTFGILIGVIVVSIFLLAAISILFAVTQGYGLENLTGFLDNLDNPNGRNVTRLFLMLNHLFTFILPAIIVAYIVSSKNTSPYLSLDQGPKYLNIALGILFILVAYPFIQKSFEWNALLPLPEWMISLESSTNESLEGLLTMESGGEFLLNILVISIVPGIGEELLFRGIIQKELYRWFKRPWVAVWIAAILFSAMHLQFQGFFPRMLLGALLGYLYLFTKNLWVPIIIHFLNNAIPIFSMYFFQIDLADLSPEESPEVPIILAFGSLLLTIGLGMYIYSRNANMDHEPEEIA